jgi:AcrR family transcriptional regulator
LASSANAAKTLRRKPAKKQAARKQSARRLADARARMYHDLIFDSAEGVFGRKGYDGATMNDIADEAGVSLKTLYCTYQNKQDLYHQIMRQRASGFVSEMNASVSDVEDPLSRIERLISAYVDYLFEHQDWLRIHLLSRIAWAFRPADEEVATSWDAVRETYSRAIRDGMDSGQVYPGDAEEMTIMMQSIMQLQMARAIDHAEPREPDETAAAILLHVRRLLCPQP